MALDDPLTIAVIASVVITALVVCAVVIFTMRKREKKPLKPSKEAKNSLTTEFSSPISHYRVSKSVQVTDAVHAKDELRILDLEREILGDAIRHLYEAHASGKITEAEREKLASSYKARMMSIKESMAKDESIVALHELEGMQEDLMKLFSERFGELTSKVEELRTRIDIKPIKEVKVQMPKSQTPIMPDQIDKDDEDEEDESETEDEDKPKKKRKPQAERQTQKTESEKRIDEMRNQIDDVMNKLGQMEVDA
jgi:hypothetical protein